MQLAQCNWRSATGAVQLTTGDTFLDGQSQFGSKEKAFPFHHPVNAGHRDIARYAQHTEKKTVQHKGLFMAFAPIVP